MILCVSKEDELVWKHVFQVLYFYSTSMVLHQKMLLMLNKIEKKYSAIAFFSIDMDYFKSFNKRFNINSLPTVIIYKNTKEIKRIIGVINTLDFTAIFDDICIV